MKGLLPKILVISFLAAFTVGAYGGSFYGWFLPRPLDTPVSLRDGSVKARSTGHGFYFLAGRSHAGGGYRGGK
ncbi:MAG TPA: hypothetical protein VMC85_01455 [Desulfomonilaceae bacterium]|nr:hypothetical protein [Desulfomonilaceae bacterium]